MFVVPGPSSRGPLSVPQRDRVRLHLPGIPGATLNAVHTSSQRKEAGRASSCGKNYLHHRFRLTSTLNGLLPFADDMND